MDQEKRDKVVRLFREMTAGSNKAADGPALQDGWPGWAGTNIINSTIVVCGEGCEVVAKLLGAKRRPR